MTHTSKAFLVKLVSIETWVLMPVMIPLFLLGLAVRLLTVAVQAGWSMYDWSDEICAGLEPGARARGRASMETGATGRGGAHVETGGAGG